MAGIQLKRRFGLFRSMIVSLIRLYQDHLSFLFYSYGSGCRFYPTCSGYALFCFQYIPIFKALYLSLWRVMRCNPYNEGGEDIPPGFSESGGKTF